MMQGQAPPGQGQGQQNFTDVTKYGMFNKNNDSEQLRFLISNNELIKRTYAFLKGGFYDSERKQIIIPSGSVPLMSDQAITEIVGALDRRISNLVSINKYETAEVEATIEVFTEELASLLVRNRARWEIKRSNIPWIVNEIRDSVKAGLNRAINGELLDSITETTRFQQVQSINQNPGFFGSIFKRRSI